VETANATVQVLGTKFSVRRYPADRSSRIVVEEGKIALRRAGAGHEFGSRTVLSANMLAQVADSGITVQPGIAVNEYTAWTKGRLVFTRVPLRDVIIELGRAYSADIRLADTTLADQPMTFAASVRTDSLPQLLDLISQTVDAYITHNGRAYEIVPGKVVKRIRTNRLPQPEKIHGR
jgi:ferric-dicitrate binding protein FerR (iron transport regulator)